MVYPLVQRRQRVVRVLESIGTDRAIRTVIRLTGSVVGGNAIPTGSRWEGWSTRPCHAMIMEVEDRQGQSFQGVFHWPTLGNKRNKFKAQITSNRVEFVIYEIIQRGMVIKASPQSEGRVVGQMLVGERPGGAEVGGYQLYLVGDRKPEPK